MSRSYKHFPVFTDNSDAGEKKSWKKIFNRKVRRDCNLDMPCYGYYRKLNNSWDICDFKFMPDFDDPENVRKARSK